MKALALVHAENYSIRREIATRTAKIEALAVDRSRFQHMPLTRWSEEAMSREPQLEARRQDVTLTERAEASRVLFSKGGRS